MNTIELRMVLFFFALGAKSIGTHNVIFKRIRIFQSNGTILESHCFSSWSHKMWNGWCLEWKLVQFATSIKSCKPREVYKGKGNCTLCCIV